VAPGALAAVLTLTAGCVITTPLESGASTVVVHAVLNGAVPDQFVVVQRTVDGEPAAPAVAGATVTITAPDGTAMTATEDHDSSIVHAATGDPGIALVYRISLDAYGVNLVPGGTYELRVHLPTGEDVAGSTTIPNATPTSARDTTAAFVPAMDTLRLAWQPVPGASSYEVRISSTANTYALFADSGVALPGTLRALNGAPVFAAGTETDIVVSAVDANYYAYYRTNSDPFTGAMVVGNLTGAVGVFGSIVELVVRDLNVSHGAP
jgi:hypothetical protein